MNSKEKKVSECFKDYKNLPIKDRVEVNMTAKKLLEIQKGNKAFLGNTINPSLHEDGKKRD